ncbi:MAG TPA: hypothetical protein VFA43_01415 [Gemmatimonadaceae bacterium]|nr:hypothetical protein [Gemmatimonadaceae bacterium]
MSSPSRLILAAVAFAATSFGASPSANVAFTSHYDGRGAEGLDDIWRGTLDRPDAGAIEIRIEPGARGAARGFVFVSRDTLAGSFGATVTGSVDGEAVHLTGPIDVGRTSGAMIDLTMHRGHGTLRVDRSHRLTAVMPSVRQRRNGPIIIIGSVLGRVTVPQ